MEMDRDYLLFNERVWQLRTDHPYTFRLPQAPKNCPVIVDAVIFADGHASGNAKAIADLYSHRRGVQEELTMLRPEVAKAASGNLDEKSLQAYFNGRVDAIKGNPRPERRGQRAALSALQTRMGIATGNSAPMSTDTDMTARVKVGLEFIDSWSAKLSAKGAIQ